MNKRKLIVPLALLVLLISIGVIIANNGILFVEDEDIPFGSINQLPKTTINVKDYGATGNGVTDDTKAIRNAIKALKSRKQKELYFPDGIYSVSGSITLDNNFKVIGDKNSIIKVCAKMSVLFCIDEKSNISISGLIIDNNGYKEHTAIKGYNRKIQENIIIDNIRSINGADNFLYISQANNIKVTNNEISNTYGRAINIYEPYDLLVDNNHVNTVESGIGLSVEGYKKSVREHGKIVISNNIVENITGGGIYVRALNGSINDVRISDNKVYNVRKAGIKVTIPDNYPDARIDNITVSNNYVDKYATELMEAGITVSDYNNAQNVSSAIVSGNTVVNGGEHAYYGLRFQGSKNIIAENNTLQGVFTHSGIFVEDADNIHLLNNNIDGACTEKFTIQGGILLSKSTNCEVANNTLKNVGGKENPAYAIHLNKTYSSIINSNIISDSILPYTSYAIYESGVGGISNGSNNIFKENTYNNEPYLASNNIEYSLLVEELDLGNQN